jgi:endonuclease/exonuclease/phosphatase family metal-dependent hydrolase
MLLRHAVVGAGIGYAGGVLGYALLRPLLRNREGWIELVDDLEPWAYAPVPVLGLLGAALGSGSLVTATASLAAAFGLRWGHRYLRRSRPTPSARSNVELTMMTFNTLAWQREGRDLEASISEANPDVVGLQEIGPRGADHLAQTLADRWPYHFITQSASSSGAAVLSRYPISEPVAFRASPSGHWWQRMTIEAPSGPFTYLNIHTKIPHIRTTHQKLAGRRFPLEFHAEQRRSEVQALVAMLERMDGPVIVGGDFNMTERSPDHRLLSTRLHDAFKAVGAGFGMTFPKRGSFPRAFPAPFPLLRLDYIWHSRHFVASWAYKGDGGQSDHHPIVAGFRLSAAAARSEPGVPLAASAV